MTISSTTSRVSYSGNGVTTNFAFPYYFLSSADLVVILKVNSTGVETVKTLTTHYTVAGAGVQAGGSVTMLTAPASGETLVIYRDPAATQDLDLVDNDALPAEPLEARLDKTLMVSQRLKDQMSRTARLPDGFTASFDTKLPALMDSNPDTVLAINSAGTGFDIGPTITDIANAAANATAAAASAAAAATSASNAATSATNAATSATNAATSETNAAASAAAAAGTVAAAIAVHEADTSNAHVAQGVSVTPSGNLSSTNVQAALQELQSDIDTLTTAGINVATKTANYTLTNTDGLILADAVSGGFTLTLPTAVGISGKIFYLKKIDQSLNSVSIATTSSQTIDDESSQALYLKDQVLTVVSDNVNWRVI